MSLYTDRTARRQYPCGRECGDPIEPGARYVRAALPPQTEPNTGDGWWVMRLHGRHWEDCPAHAAMLARVDEASSRLREALGVTCC